VLDSPFPGGHGTEADLKEALAEADRRQKETLVLLEAARAVMAYEHFAEAAREIFDHCREVIGASAGYVSLLNEAGTENELVFLDAGGLPCTVDLDLPMPIRGLRAEGYETGQVVYDNNFSKSTHVRFLPKGHMTLENVLFAPLKTPEGKVVGLLGLSNKPGGFTEYDAHLAVGFAEIAAIALVSKRAGAALQESEEKFRNIFESAPVGIFKSTREGKFLEVNPALAKILGYDSSQELMTIVNRSNIAEQLYADPGRRPEAVQDILGCRDWLTQEHEFRKKSARVITARVKVRAVQSPEGDVILEGFVEDVTEEKRAQESLRWESAVNAALARLYDPLMSPSSSILEISRGVLAQAQEITGSEHGYVATIDPVTGDHADLSMSEMTAGQCRVEEPSRRFIRRRGQDEPPLRLWSQALRTRQAFFTNAPLSHPAFLGVPAGQVLNYSCLSVPVMLGEELVGQIALADPSRDYTAQDLEAVKRLGTFFALAIQRKRCAEKVDKAQD